MASMYGSGAQASKEIIRLYDILCCAADFSNKKNLRKFLTLDHVVHSSRHHQLKFSAIQLQPVQPIVLLQLIF